MGFFSKRRQQPQPIEIKGRQLECPICRNDTFFIKKTLLNTRLLSFLELDWANRNATCFVCSDCTHISWFDT